MVTRPTLYPVLRAFGVLVLEIFLRKIVVRREEPVPETGPLVFASNHPNGLLDPLSVIYVTRRPVHFLAKSGLLRVPLLGPLLRRCGVLPVYRRMDDPGEVAKNEETFAACYELLAEGGAIGIFPEGVSHVDLELKRLKTGAARIALGAEARHDFTLGIRLVPIGLTFPERSRFRSVLGIQIGRSIAVAPWRARYEQDPQGAARELTEELQGVIRGQVVHLDHLEITQVVEAVDALYSRELLRLAHDPSKGEEPSEEARLDAQRNIAAAVSHFFRADPALFEQTSKKVLAFKALVDRLRIREEALEDYRDPRSWRLWLVEALAYVVIGLPFALYGIVNNIVPWAVTDLLWRRTAKTPQAIAQTKIYWSMAIYPLLYVLQAWLVGKWLGILPAVWYALSLPVAGLFAVAYQRKLRAIGRRYQVGSLALRKPGVIEKLQSRREALIDELEALRQRYLRETGSIEGETKT